MGRIKTQNANNFDHGYVYISYIKELAVSDNAPWFNDLIKFFFEILSLLAILNNILPYKVFKL